MASIETTKTGFAVKWRLGGTRTGSPQTLTIPIPPGSRPGAAAKLADAAKHLAESRRHAITRDEVRAAVLGPTTAAPTGTPLLADWIPQYIDARRDSDDIQPDTLDRYQLTLARYARPRLGHLYLTDISHDVLTDWVTWLRGQPSWRGGLLSAGTVHRIYAVLQGCLGAAVPRWLPANPAARPPGVRRSVVGLPRVDHFEGMFLEPWEVDAIAAHCAPQVADMLRVAVRTGLRLGELLVLRVRDVTVDGRRPRIEVRRALKNDGSIGPPKSVASRRTVTISPATCGVFGPHLAGKSGDALVFPSPTGKGRVWSQSTLRRRYWLPAVAAAQRCPQHPPTPPNKPQRGPTRRWRDDEVSTCLCAGRLKRTPRWHDLRHTHVSLLVEAGWAPKRIQKRVGHATYQFTMNTYGHLWDGDDSDRLDGMERLLSEDEDG